MKQGAAAKGVPEKQPYIKTSVTVFEYNTATRENKSQGQFTFQLQPSTGCTVMTIFRPGCANPLTTFNVSRTINWTLQNGVYVYFHDAQRVQRLLQFTDAVSAAQATAAVALLLCVHNSKEVGTYEASQLVQGQAINVGDEVQLSMWAFTFKPFPYIQGCVLTRENFTTTLASNKLPVGLVKGLTGMTCGNSRTVFLPAAMSGLESGRDPEFAEVNTIVVVNLTQATSKNPAPTPTPAPTPAPAAVAQVEECPSHETESEECESPARKKRGSVPSAIIDLGVDAPMEATSEEPVQETEQENEVESSVDPEAAARDARLARIRKAGGVAGAFAIPTLPKKGDDARPVSNAAAVTTASSVRPSGGRPGGTGERKATFEGRLDDLERSIDERLDALTGVGTETADVIAGVTNLASFVHMKQQEINRLKAELDKERHASAAQCSTQAVETAKKEVTRLQTANAQREESIRSIDARLKTAEATLQESSTAAKGREKTLVKRLLDSVFRDVGQVFEAKTWYSGQSVSDHLRSMLRDHSYTVMSDIDDNGLF